MFSLQPYILTRFSDALVPDSASNPRESSSLVVLQGEAGDDLFSEPGTERRVSQLRPLGAWLAGDQFQLSARVHVDFRATFDSAVLFGWVDQDRWFKICSELDPQGRARVVSVVTRGRSDDSNGGFLSEDAVFLRVSRAGRLIALHSSSDGMSWDLVRLFEMNIEATESMFLGIAVQSPMGGGTVASFDEIRFAPHALANPRDGS